MKILIIFNVILLFLFVNVCASQANEAKYSFVDVFDICKKMYKIK